MTETEETVNQPAETGGMRLHRRVALSSGGWVALSARVEETLSLDDWRWLWDLEALLVRYEREREEG